MFPRATTIPVPVASLDSSLAGERASYATSTGWPEGFMGMVGTHARFFTRPSVRFNANPPFA